MNVEIWSDIMCPFCYIGKRKFEAALKQFDHKDDITVTWRSFQLNPELQAKAGTHIDQYLAEHKGWTLEYARKVNQQVTDMAKQAGLEYHFDKAVVANTALAHQLIHIANKNGVGDQVKEALLKAYFTEGKDVGNIDALVAIGTTVGLEQNEVKQALEEGIYEDKVIADQQRAAEIGVRGVPFFVFDEKYAVSGAQPPEVFLGALQQSWNEAQSALEGDAGFCTVDGECK